MPKSKEIEAVDRAAELRALRMGALDLLRKNKVTVEASEQNLDIIPTGFSAFDHDILGIGGIPRGYLVQIFGPESSGKTTLATRILAQAQRACPDKIAYLLDTEFTYNLERAEKHGVNISPDALVVTKSNIAEEVFDQTIKAVASGAVSIVVIDSIGNLMSLKSANTNYWEMKNGKREHTPQPGEMAKAITAFVQQLTYYASKNNVLVIGINQIRSKIGVLYGDPTDVPGGHAWKHDLAIDMRTRRVEFDDESVLIAVTVKKNKFSAPHATSDDNHLRVYFENGIEKGRTVNLYDQAIRKDIIRKNGSWLTWYNADGETEAQLQGKDKILALLLENPDKLEKLEAQINATSTTNHATIEELMEISKVCRLPYPEED